MASRRTVQVGVLALAAALGACPYAPKVQDCKVLCGEGGACPQGTTCNTLDGYCRPPNAEGACTCEPGAERGCGGSVGECRPGVQRCLDTRSWGACVGERGPTGEVCDGKDNDCDGTSDEDLTDGLACDKAQGVCFGKMRTCVNGSYAAVCTAADYGPYYEAVEASCDGRDNDCDGIVDSTPARVLVPSGVWNFQLVGLDGGYALIWETTPDGGAGSNPVRVQSYNRNFLAEGPPTVVANATARATIETAAWGDRVYVVYSENNEVTWQGFVWSRGGAVLPLVGLPRGDGVGRLSLGANATGLVGVYKTDGGAQVLRWSPTGQTVAASALPLGRPATIAVTGVNVSTRGTAVAVNTTEYDDGGVDGGGTRSYDAVLDLVGTRTVPGRYVWQEASFFEAHDGRLQATWAWSRYLSIIIIINESGVSFFYDLFSGDGSYDLRKIPDYQALGWARGVSTPTQSVVAWSERGEISLGVPINGSNVRSRILDLDGGNTVSMTIASPGDSPAVGVVYRMGPTPSSLWGASVCPP